MTKPQEVNGTNGNAALPATEATKQAEQSTDSEQDEAGDTDEPGNSKSGGGAVQPARILQLLRRDESDAAADDLSQSR